MFSNPIRANHYNLPALAPASSSATAASDLHNYKLASSLHQPKSNPKVIIKKGASMTPTSSTSPFGLEKVMNSEQEDPLV